jgi:uncharacterized protein (TIGR02145 family)
MRITTTGSVGIGTATPAASAVLEVSSNTQGLIVPRMTTVQINAIANPVEGLLVYNTTLQCLAYYAKGTFTCTYNNPVAPPALGRTYTTHYNGWVNGTYTGNASTITHTAGETFNENTLCVDKLISAGGCGGDQIVYGSTYIPYALIEINGQCWMAENLREIPSAFASYTATSWKATTASDMGYWGYYNVTTPAGTAGWGTTEPPNMNGHEGYLYQWSAAMNGATAERSRGACPYGFHIPSDCEFMYLEHGLGLTVAQQIVTGTTTRSSGFVGTKLQIAGTSGFSALLTGSRSFNGVFYVRSSYGNRWTSSQVDNTTATFRETSAANDEVSRSTDPKAVAYSVRCLKD